MVTGVSACIYSAEDYQIKLIIEMCVVFFDDKPFRIVFSLKHNLVQLHNFSTNLIND